MSTRPQRLQLFRTVEEAYEPVSAIERPAASTRADKLVQAILDKAFRGELVPTEAELARQEGREYEPAAAVLERIVKAGVSLTHVRRMSIDPPASVIVW